ncbi:MAG TPA: hypothetical protein DCP96_02085 [Lachnospiraceae bacterium]|jgi:hypothetical protein|nr:hypothetical protein [Lachnospiraceae bacterium]MDY5704787.1 hypothetical protein [Lachnospiraceae bacterium]HAN50473.1 hypothetical protein [Lachnospiraceae bacterium]
MTSLERATEDLIQTLRKMGYPESFGLLIAANLRTEKMIGRMIGYLKNAKPQSDAEIADEMLAIMDDRDRWTQKKMSEYYNSKYNEYLNSSLREE